MIIPTLPVLIFIEKISKTVETSKILTVSKSYSQDYLEEFI